MILDCVGSSFWEQNIKSLAVDGRWVLYGLLGGGEISGNLLGGLLKKRGSLIATTLRSRPLSVSAIFVPIQVNVTNIVKKTLVFNGSINQPTFRHYCLLQGSSDVT